MAHFQKQRMRNLEKVALIIRNFGHKPETEQEIQDLYDTVMWNIGCKRQTAEEYVRLVYKFSTMLSNQESQKS
jgi:hypothetical protein